MNSDKRKIVFAGGGTAGHIFPLLEIFEALKENKEYKFEFFGSGTDFERQIAKKHRIAYQKILSGKMRRYFGFFSFLSNTIDIVRFMLGTIQASFIFYGERPSVIFSKGGYASLPTVLAGVLWRVPIIVHESDIMPGLANRISLKFAKRVATAFPIDAYDLNVRKKGFYGGLPLQKGFYQSSNNKDGAYILVFGGSQGASSLNNLVFNNLDKILKIGPVIHLTGKGDYQNAQAIASKLPKELAAKYSPYEFRDDMDKLIGGARMIVCRSGANSIFEATAFSKRLLLVPIPESVTKHQAINALYLKSRDMAEIFLHSESEERFVSLINKTYTGKQPTSSILDTPWSAKVISQAIVSEIETREFLSSKKKFFLIGIGGVSMRGVASILQKMGKNVFGSDLKSGGHSARNIKKDIDLVVYSSAASHNSSARQEHEQAEQYKIPIIKRSKMIGDLMRNKSGISVSGMHGKTTTSALVAKVLGLSGLDPSYLIGAQPSQAVPTSNYSSNEYFVVEACEYDGSFLDFPTTAAIITNIEEEHLDYFKGGLPEIIDTFSRFVKQIRPGGFLVYNVDDKNSRKVIKDCGQKLLANGVTVKSFGFSSESDITVSSYGSKDEKISFKLKTQDFDFVLEPRVAGRHFAYNCAAAFAVSHYLGISSELFKVAADKFVGAKGRFELIGKRGNIPVFYDYGHHPTELKAVFESIDGLFPRKRKFFIFQPHQQDRFNNFFEDFYREIEGSNMDVIGILPVYAVAGRDAKPQFTSRDLVDKLSGTKKRSFLLENYDEAALFLKKNCRPGDFVITVGATDIWKVADEFIRK